MEEFGTLSHDAVINFVGVGDPALASAAGSTIFGITAGADGMVLKYLDQHPECRYFFMSSGAAYGAAFAKPVGSESPAMFPINRLEQQDWYGAAKFHAECLHRARPAQAIFDIRVFNYISPAQDLGSRYLIADALRAVRDQTVLLTSPENIVRDYLHPDDFQRLVLALLSAPAANLPLDCYTRKAADKLSILEALKDNFGLRYEIADSAVGINATGNKQCYYSENRVASAYGYEPGWSSLDGVLDVSHRILSRAGVSP